MDEERQPWWIVNAVFDPEGTGSDFSYTVGLAGAGVPELHLWARPTLGEDPGLDWKFSQRDTCGILNRLAWRLLDGTLSVGDTWVETYDEGFVEAWFSVHAPVDAEDLDAFGARDAPVLPITWELRRPPLGDLRPMDPTAQAVAAAAYDDIAPRVQPMVLPPEWDLPRVPTWDADQRFGPRTPLVLARAAQLSSASGDDWVAIAEHVLVAHDRVPFRYAGLVARAAAREPGRLPIVERVESAVEDLMAGFGETWGFGQLAAVRAWFFHDGRVTPELEVAWRHVLDEITVAATTHLVVESVADLLPERVTLLGQGVVLAALTPPGIAPDPRWRCSVSVDRAIADLVASAPLAALVDAAAAWDRALEGEASWPIRATSWTSAGCSRPVTELLDVASCVTAARALESRGLGLGVLQRWLTSLATVLAERAALAPHAVDRFVETSCRVPGLVRLVNTPLTTEAA
jgi:hypothetical protein